MDAGDKYIIDRSIFFRIADCFGIIVHIENLCGAKFSSEDCEDTSAAAEIENGFPSEIKIAHLSDHKFSRLVMAGAKSHFGVNHDFMLTRRDRIVKTGADRTEIIDDHRLKG
jgi:hypothetical protein